ncbi:acyl-CoA synthetase [Zhongshania marina]|uniref:Acyl-CoA synthetase n=1 Tax=Zhongshania marina TaxID=2304603 RepID=A0ABX9W919_9GAMM|nr:acyl-CoA synthetase [Zhongshania marina]
MSTKTAGGLFPGGYLPRFAEKPAVIMAESGNSLSFDELDRFANQLGRLYQWNGLKAGDHVAYCLENRLECPAVQWAAHYVGLYYTFISNRLTGAEAAYIVENCNAQILIVSAKTAPNIVNAIRSLPNPPKIFSVDASPGCSKLSDALAAFDNTPLQNTLEGSDMLYSSGTTGKPKGVKPNLTGKPLGSTSLIGSLLQQGFAADENSVYLSPAPFYHAAPMKWGQGIIALGGTMIMMEKFDAESCLQAIERYSVTHSQWVPTMFHRLLSLSNEIKTRYNLSSQTVAVHAAAPCPIPTKQAMIDWWGPIIYEYYSCTEAIGMTFTDTNAWLKYPGTVGRALLGTPHILDEEGNELPTGKDGAVYFSDGPSFSYHKDDIKTAQAHSKSGWATVGDIGHLNKEGFLFLTDRQSNMIISGGVNVYPQETENTLCVHPDVRDAAVFGIPHADLGEQVCAIIQLESHVSPSENIKEKLNAYCRENLSPIKCPRVIEFRETLPREPNGKLLKRLLKDEFTLKQN